MKRALILSIIGALVFPTSFVSAEMVRGINIDFVAIGNAGNVANTGGAGDNGRGAVGYNYQIGRYEVTNAQWNAFTAAAGVPTGNPSNAYDENTILYTGTQQPANNISWYEALQFCNYLTTGDKSKGVYQFSGDNINPGSFLGINRSVAKATYGAIYFLPTEDEWYKAAYYKPDASGYSLYANGLNTITAADNGWNYSGGTYTTPWNIGTGSMEQNGTFAMMGNVWEWLETYTVRYPLPAVNYLRGGSFYNDSTRLRSSSGSASANPYDEDEIAGFRIASIVPEPCTLLLLGVGGLLIRKR